MKALCDSICVPSRETARIQECHIMIGHILCRLVEERCFPKDKPQ
jgi:D-sedoheptulose 7-phosphate isomerase